METLLEIPKEDYKKTIVYLFMLNEILKGLNKNPTLSRKKKKQLLKQNDDLVDFIEKYENTVLKTVKVKD